MHRILSDLARQAAARVGCKSIEAVDVRPAPERLRVQLRSVGAAPTSEVQELWTLRQCGATIGHIVTLREYGNRRGVYQLTPLKLPQLLGLSAAGAAEITEQQVRAEYEHVVRTFGREYQVRHILVGSLAAAQLALERLRAAEPFEAVARDLSTDPASRLKGGQLGWNIPSNFVDQFSAALVQLAPQGLTTRPVQTRFGWHVIELLAVREQALPPYEQVKDQIAADLRKRASATTGR